MITLVVRFNEDSGAIEDQHEPVRSVTRSYRKKSPSESGVTPSVQAGQEDAKMPSKTRRTGR